MPIIDISMRDLVTLERDATIARAAELMRQHHVAMYWS